MAGEELFISGGPLTDVVIGETGIAAVVQNVRTILATRVGSLFLDRHFGVSQNMVDDPMPVAIQKFRSEAVMKVERHEPRVKVLRVDVEESDAANGELVPRVLVRIRENMPL